MISENKENTLLKSGLNGGQKGIWFFVHVNMNVSHIILILVANWQEIFGEWLINPRPKTESSEVTLRKQMYLHFEYLEFQTLPFASGQALARGILDSLMSTTYFNASALR